MGKAVLLTNHYCLSKRRAGFHFIADALVKQGYEVHFACVNVGWSKRLKGHSLFSQPGFKGNLKPGAVRVGENIVSHVLYSPLSVGSSGNALLRLLITPLFWLYPRMLAGRIKELVVDAEVVVFESGPALLFFDLVRRAAPCARLIYRVSDDIAMLHSHPALLEKEKEILPHFSLVSVPCQTIADSLRERAPGANIVLQRHGLWKEPFDNCRENPYAEGTTNLVFVGTCFLDDEFIEIASRIHPEWSIHIIGPFPEQKSRDNITVYGELPFPELVKYIKFADVGLQCREGMPYHGLTLTDSLKVMQYLYCRLPVVAPEAIPSDRPNWFTYRRNEESVNAALKQALAYDRDSLDISDVNSWDEMVARMLALSLEEEN